MSRKQDNGFFGRWQGDQGKFLAKLEKSALGTVVFAMIGVRESSYEVVRGIHSKMAKGRGLAGVDRMREGMDQAARNLST